MTYIKGKKILSPQAVVAEFSAKCRHHDYFSSDFQLLAFLSTEISTGGIKAVAASTGFFENYQKVINTYVN
jgi:hypothetical protein